MAPIGNEVGRAASTAGESSLVEKGARIGYAASGIMHLLMGWLAFRVAWQDYSGATDQSGAFGLLAESPLGLALLWVLVVGFALLAIWNITEAFRVQEVGDKVKCAAKGIAYLSLASTSGAFALKQGSSSAHQSESTTRTLLATPWGVWIVGIIGAVVIGVGGYHVFKGATKRFHQDLVEDPGTAATAAGMVGYIAKGLALLVLGVLFVRAALEHSANKARGLDGALKAFLELPLGQWLLTGVAAGLVCYGVYSFFRAKYARV